MPNVTFDSDSKRESILSLKDYFKKKMKSVIKVCLFAALAFILNKHLKKDNSLNVSPKRV